MKQATIKLSTDDFVDSYPTVLHLKTWQVRQLLRDLSDHVTHAATRDNLFIFRMSANVETQDVVCPKCGSLDIIPVLYGYINESDDSDESDKRLLRLEQEGKISCPGCDASDEYNLECKTCHHRWELKLGMDFWAGVKGE